MSANSKVTGWTEWQTHTHTHTHTHTYAHTHRDGQTQADKHEGSY